MATGRTRTGSVNTRIVFLLLYSMGLSAILLVVWGIRDARSTVASATTSTPVPQSGKTDPSPAEPIVKADPSPAQPIVKADPTPAKPKVESTPVILKPTIRNDLVPFSSRIFSGPLDGFSVQRVDDSLMFTISGKYTDLDRDKRFAFTVGRETRSFAGVKLKRHSRLALRQTIPGSLMYFYDLKEPEINQRTLYVTAWVRPDGEDWRSCEVKLTIVPPFSGVDPSKYDVIETEPATAPIKELFEATKAVSKRIGSYAVICSEKEHTVILEGQLLPSDIVSDFLKHAQKKIGREHFGYSVGEGIHHPRLTLDPATHRKFVNLTARVIPYRASDKRFLYGTHWDHLPLDWTEERSNAVAEFALNYMRKHYTFAFEK